MKLTKNIVIQARTLAWEGKKISDIALLLNCKQSALYAAINGTTWLDIKEPKPLIKQELEVFTCSICKEIKHKSEVSQGRECKKCKNIYKQQLPKNKESERKRNKKQREKNPELWSKYQKDYQIKNVDRLQKWKYDYYQKNKALITEKRKEYNKQPHRIIINRMRKALRRCLTKQTIGKLRYLPYTKEEFVKYLLNTKPLNLELIDCHIDHIKPLAAFDKEQLTNPLSKEFLECWSLSNLRLISAKENLQKSSKYG